MDGHEEAERAFLIARTWPEFGFPRTLARACTWMKLVVYIRDLWFWKIVLVVCCYSFFSPDCQLLLIPNHSLSLAAFL